MSVTVMTDNFARIVEFSTDLLPEQDRIAYWREHYGHIMLRVDLEPAKDASFEACMTSLALPGLQIIEASATPAKISRSGQYLADGNDDVVLAVNRGGSVIVASGSREHSLGVNEAILLTGNEPTSFHRTSMGKSTTLRVPRAMLASALVDADDAVMRVIPQNRGALRLLSHYTHWLFDAGVAMDSQLLNLSVTHVHDLLARRQQFDRNAPRLAGGRRHAIDRRRPLSRLMAMVTKKIPLTANTTAPPVGTSSFVEITRPPTPARNATTTLHNR